jgi:hypothetical protein
MTRAGATGAARVAGPQAPPAMLEMVRPNLLSPIRSVRILQFFSSLLVYSTVITLYLAYVGIAGGLTGLLLWPVVALHVILTALLTLASTRDSAL